jgi:hypothetical protein
MFKIGEIVRYSKKHSITNRNNYVIVRERTNQNNNTTNYFYDIERVKNKTGIQELWIPEYKLESNNEYYRRKKIGQDMFKIGDVVSYTGCQWRYSKTPYRITDYCAVDVFWAVNLVTGGHEVIDIYGLKIDSDYYRRKKLERICSGLVTR